MLSPIGGLREQHVQFKDCVFSFNGAVTPANLLSYLEKDILSETIGNSFYGERRNITVDRRFGGNPSILNESEWINSLGRNPALLKIEELTPWYEVAQDPQVKENLQSLIQNLTTAADIARIREESEITEERIKRRVLSLQSSIGLLNNDGCQILSARLGPVSNCSRGCTTSIKLQSRTGLLDDRPLLYVRDPITGFVQARLKLADGK